MRCRLQQAALITVVARAVLLSEEVWWRGDELEVIGRSSQKRLVSHGIPEGTHVV